LLAILSLDFAPAVLAQPCPDKNPMYWQAFTPGGESDLSARHQQRVLKKKCPAIDTLIQYKSGAGGGLMWAQANSLPGDGVDVYGINLPHIVLQPLEGQVQYRTEDLVPVYWFHYTPDALVVREASPIKTFQDFVKAAKAEQRKRMSDLWAALNNDPEMKDLAAKSGFERVNVGVEQMDAFMKERVRNYTEVAQRMGLGKK